MIYSSIIIIMFKTPTLNINKTVDEFNIHKSRIRKSKIAAGDLE